MNTVRRVISLRRIEKNTVRRGGITDLLKRKENDQEDSPVHPHDEGAKPVSRRKEGEKPQLSLAQSQHLERNVAIS